MAMQTVNIPGHPTFIWKTPKNRRKRGLTNSLLRHSAGLIMFAFLGGLGSEYALLATPYTPLAGVFQATLFVFLLGKANISDGLNKILALFSSLPTFLDMAGNRISDNPLLFLINFFLCIGSLILIKFGIHLLVYIPFFIDLLRSIPFVSDNAPTQAFQHFWLHIWYYPTLLAYLASGLNWLCFNEKANAWK